MQTRPGAVHYLNTDSTSSVRLMCMAAAAASAAEEEDAPLPPPPPLRVAGGSDEAAAAAAAADDEMKTDACRPMSVLHSCKKCGNNMKNEDKENCK